ncbi:MAG: hypothetical protein ACPHY7_00390 [Gammaproteobacteria bacterium]
MILREDNKTGMDVWINSFGGCASNFLSHKLESVGLKTRTPEWRDTYCHYPYPKDLGIPIVYLYRDMRTSLISQERRNFADINYQKLTTTNFTTAVEFQPMKLLGSMFHQFMNFIHYENKNLLILHKDELFTEDGVNALNKHLGTKFDVFEEETKKYVRDDEEDQDYKDWLEHRPEFKKFAAEIHFVNNFRKKVPLNTGKVII